MKIGIFYNPAQADEETTSFLSEKIVAAGHEVSIFTEEGKISGVERLIVLGGDGTVLRAARRAAECGLALFGVNFGRLGFLTEFEREEAACAVDLVLDERAVRIERTMLEVTVGGVSTHCLNEFAMLHEVVPGQNNRVVDISAAIDGVRAAEFHADGIIVATPTGSTAYSLSAGGSIITPDCAAFLLTPVCAFSMRSRPIAFSDGCTLTLSLTRGTELLLFGDGNYLGRAKEGDVVTVGKSPRRAVFLTRNKNEYFRRLTEKIN